MHGRRRLDAWTVMYLRGVYAWVSYGTAGVLMLGPRASSPAPSAPPSAPARPCTAAPPHRRAPAPPQPPVSINRIAYRDRPVRRRINRSALTPFSPSSIHKDRFCRKPNLIALKTNDQDWHNFCVGCSVQFAPARCVEAARNSEEGVLLN